MDRIDTYVDILIKLIIAFIGINAPLTAYLLANFNKHIEALNFFIEMRKRRSGQNDASSLEKKLEQEILKKDEGNLKYIEPKKNIFFIFTFLFVSLGTIVIYTFIKPDSSCNCHKCYFYCCTYYISIFFVFLCTFFFCCSVWRIYKVIWAYIDTKKIVEDYEEQKEEVQQPPQNSMQSNQNS